jgi:DNA-binding transcriptional ArsR family regulator
MLESSVLISELNRVIHEPARLAILTVLASCVEADFMFLQTATGLSKGNLSVQISRLEDAGFVVATKVLQGKKILTIIKLSRKGRRELLRYWACIEGIRTSGAKIDK